MAVQVAQQAATAVLVGVVVQTLGQAALVHQVKDMPEEPQVQEETTTLVAAVELAQPVLVETKQTQAVLGL